MWTIFYLFAYFFVVKSYEDYEFYNLFNKLVKIFFKSPYFVPFLSRTGWYNDGVNGITLNT